MVYANIIHTEWLLSYWGSSFSGLKLHASYEWWATTSKLPSNATCSHSDTSLASCTIIVHIQSVVHMVRPGTLNSFKIDTQLIQSHPSHHHLISISLLPGILLIVRPHPDYWTRVTGYNEFASNQLRLSRSSIMVFSINLIYLKTINRMSTLSWSFIKYLCAEFAVCEGWMC